MASAVKLRRWAGDNLLEVLIAIGAGALALSLLLNVGGSHPLDDAAAPSLTLSALDGESFSLEEHRGKVVVLDFFATWCGPCREALPHLDELHEEYKDKGVVVRAVNVRESDQEVRAFLKQAKLSVPVLMDKDGVAADAYGVTGIPQTVVIGKDGMVARVFVGAGMGFARDLEAEIKAALEGS